MKSLSLVISVLPTTKFGHAQISGFSILRRLGRLSPVAKKFAYSSTRKKSPQYSHSPPNFDSFPTKG